MIKDFGCWPSAHPHPSQVQGGGGPIASLPSLLDLAIACACKGFLETVHRKGHGATWVLSVGAVTLVV